MSDSAWCAQRLSGYVAERLEFDSFESVNEWVSEQQHPEEWMIRSPGFLDRRGEAK